MNKRILIIDDEENIRQMTMLALEAAGYEVGEAGSGIEAFAIIGGDDSWDAVLLDQKMPGLAGTEILRRLKVLLPSAPVIMMTAFASVELAVEAMKLGASDFVRKPMTPEVLRNALTAALAKPRNRQVVQARAGGKARSPQEVTLTCFAVRRAVNLSNEESQLTRDQRFIVRWPDGREQEVVVQIDPKAIAAVENAAEDLSLDNEFWTEQAERFLHDFLWNDGRAPANCKLTLKGVESGALEKARRKRSDD